MEELTHIKSVIGIILGLSLTHLIKGSVIFIQHPGRKKVYFVHSLWVFYVFLLIIHFWWWEFNLKLITEWYFIDYFFIICYILIYYLLCAILYPDDLRDYTGYEDYFYSRKNWFFAILAISYIADMIDTAIKGGNYFLYNQTEYYIRIATHVVLCLIAIKYHNKVFHTILAILFIVYELSYILRLFNVE
ncbi:hypothetical protein [Flavobacterium sp. MDT1-60]|uniref:hypothetical protein n=1 Tax=Flavobacterium sp. MDT1-60 TaxID=1979344 RepID=UPI00177AD191|nr:hypothetical protein [Flavobacterium sp. MDT1-60]QOG03282.1 hypothetical protein IHE43_03300 [Flavobacterium sp. MDT1-60]